MHSLVELVDHAQGLPPASAIFVVCLAALAVVWKALDVVARSQRNKLPRKKP